MNFSTRRFPRASFEVFPQDHAEAIQGPEYRDYRQNLNGWEHREPLGYRVLRWLSVFLLFAVPLAVWMGVV